MFHITSLVMQKLPYSHYVYGRFLLPWQPNQDADWQTFTYFELSLPKQHLYQISHTASVVLEVLSLKKTFFLILPWQPNKMATSHRNHKTGRR